jgi:hypothetical protein
MFEEQGVCKDAESHVVELFGRSHVFPAVNQWMWFPDLQPL